MTMNNNDLIRRVNYSYLMEQLMNNGALPGRKVEWVVTSIQSGHGMLKLTLHLWEPSLAM